MKIALWVRCISSTSIPSGVSRVRMSVEAGRGMGGDSCIRASYRMTAVAGYAPQRVGDTTRYPAVTADAIGSSAPVAGRAREQRQATAVPTRYDRLSPQNEERP